MATIRYFSLNVSCVKQHYFSNTSSYRNISNWTKVFYSKKFSLASSRRKKHYSLLDSSLFLEKYKINCFYESQYLGIQQKRCYCQFIAPIVLNINILRCSTGSSSNDGSQRYPVSTCLLSSRSSYCSTSSDGRPSEEKLAEVYPKLTQNVRGIFHQPLNVALYTKNLTFENNITGSKKVGIGPYFTEVYKLKFYGYMFITVEMNILKATVHPEEGTIKIRWRMDGLTLTTQLMNLLTLKRTRKAYYDGFSTFYVGEDGLIYRHVLDNVLSDGEKETSTVGPNIVQQLVGMASKKITPQSPLSSMTDSKEKLKRKDSDSLVTPKL